MPSTEKIPTDILKLLQGFGGEYLNSYISIRHTTIHRFDFDEYHEAKVRSKVDALGPKYGYKCNWLGDGTMNLCLVDKAKAIVVKPDVLKKVLEKGFSGMEKTLMYKVDHGATPQSIIKELEDMVDQFFSETDPSRLTAAIELDGMRFKLAFNRIKALALRQASNGVDFIEIGHRVIEAISKLIRPADIKANWKFDPFTGEAITSTYTSTH